MLLPCAEFFSQAFSYTTQFVVRDPHWLMHCSQQLSVGSVYHGPRGTPLEGLRICRKMDNSLVVAEQKDEIKIIYCSSVQHMCSVFKNPNLLEGPDYV